ncbi:MAG: hypothetical protein QNK37_32180 [Acidobacteriota bacterium]|nr:hypothetical protein [Acidobacteriota bacterium]
MIDETGIRDTLEGGYLDPTSLSLSATLITRIEDWLRCYETAHADGYSDESVTAGLDEEGIAICHLIHRELGDIKIQYFSEAKAEVVLLPLIERQ